MSDFCAAEKVIRTKQAPMDSVCDDGFECQIKWFLWFIPSLTKKEVYLRGVDSVEEKLQKCF